MKLAFLAANFPCLTETFVFREWIVLSQHPGLDVHVFAIRKPKGYRIMEVQEGPDPKVNYLRPDRLLEIAWAALCFPFLHPRRSFCVARLLFRELIKMPMNRVPALCFQVMEGIYLGGYLKKKRFEAIHGHFSSASNISLFAHIISGIPFSYTIYANNDLFTAPLPYFNTKMDHCRFVVTDTEYNRRMINLLTEFQYEEKIHVIHSGLDFAEFGAAETKTACSVPLRLLSVGSLSGFKGYPTVFKALQKVEKSGVKFVYRIAGGGAPADFCFLEGLIDSYGLNGSVELLGPQQFDDVREQMEWCDLFLMASEINAGGKRDGLPTVIIEAMLAKRLVISTYISDIPNNVKNRETGLIVAEKNPAQLADAIVYAEENSASCMKMVSAAHAMALEKFDASRNYKKLANLLNGQDK